MKKLLTILCFALVLSSLVATPSAKSIFYADSYMLRAHGVEASYWNPAKLSKNDPTDFWLPLVNTSVYVANNALDLDTYNFFVTRDTLHTEDKEKLLNKIDGSLRFSSGANISVFGITMGNTAISSSTHFYAKGGFSKHFLNIMLYGNTEESYEFTVADNNLSALAYTDFTFGMGDLTLPYIPEHYPQIKAGFSASLLAGTYNITTEEYNGFINNNQDDGMSVLQEIKLRSGIGGLGFKSMLGLYSELTPDLEAGITLDNIAGFINWGLVSQMDTYHFSADSVFVSNISEDFYVSDSESIDIDGYTTSLPPELRLGVMYKHEYAVVSADWVHGFKETASTSAIGRLSLGTSFLPLPFLPLSFGISLPNSRSPLRISYGIGYQSRSIDFGLAVQTYDSALPGYKSKGVSLATSMSLGF
jgi:hypothetical protein